MPTLSDATSTKLNDAPAQEPIELAPIDDTAPGASCTSEHASPTSAGHRTFDSRPCPTCHGTGRVIVEAIRPGR